MHPPVYGDTCERRREREQRETVLALSTAHGTVAATNKIHEVQVGGSSIVKWHLASKWEERGE